MEMERFCSGKSAPRLARNGFRRAVYTAIQGIPVADISTWNGNRSPSFEPRSGQLEPLVNVSVAKEVPLLLLT